MEEIRMSGYRKLSRTASQRKALLRSQVTSLLYHGKIITTEAKAKETQKIVEGLIALAVRLIIRESSGRDFSRIYSMMLSETRENESGVFCSDKPGARPVGAIRDAVSEDEDEELEKYQVC